MISFSIFNSFLLKASLAGILLEEEHIPEIHLINLTDWGWILFLSAVTLVIWALILFQVKSKGSHPYGMVVDSDNQHESEEH